MKKKHLKWPKIGALYNLMETVEYLNDEKDIRLEPTLYKAKNKLHGTNVGIQIHSNGTVIPQGRNIILSEKNDQNGFAKYVKSNEELFSSLALDKTVVLYGEWCGPGIHRKVAVTKIPEKIFAIFAMKNGDSIYIVPNTIEMYIRNNCKPIPNLYVIPWVDNFAIELDWWDRESMKSSVDEIESVVNRVEGCDPFVKKFFDIEGVGEGVVLYPIIDDLDFIHVTDLLFKAKGDEHKVTKDEKGVRLAAEVSPDDIHFVDKFVTDNRMMQGVHEVCDDVFDIKKTGEFIKWVNKDIMEESEEERNLSNIKWKKVSQMINRRVSAWYVKKCKEI